MADETLSIGATADNPFIGNRRSALANSARYYINPRRPCKQGHNPTVRLSSNTMCVACQRTWLERNFESVQARRKAFWNENRDRLRAELRARYAANPEPYKAAAKKNGAENRERRNETNLAWRIANKEHLAVYYEEWRVANPEAVAAKAHKRRAAKLGSAEHFTKADVQAVYGRQKGRCIYCPANLRNGYHIDHIMPFALGGDNSRRNIALTCVPCNRGKSKTHPIDFARKRLGLLL